MLVLKKESNNDNVINSNINNNVKSRTSNKAYNVILYILKNFSDLSIDDQYTIFSKMVFTQMKKEGFLKLRTKVLLDYDQKINHESVTITDLKASYHISNGMLETHFDGLEQINDQLEYYENEFIREKNKPHNDIDTLAKISLVMERLINRRSILNTGTPIILFFIYQQKKQKIEIQQIKEKYAQKSLNEIVNITEEKKEQDSKETSNLNIQENSIVTNNTDDIDELERRAKLQDSRIRQTKGNTNRQDHNSTDEELRVQSVTNGSNPPSSGGSNTVTEDNRSGDERRTKEAVF